jgi:predicted TIM-barrel fold metal-dependent hydrolase
MNPETIVDAWMQFPTAEFLRDPMFESLRRWTTGSPDAANLPAVPSPGEALTAMRRQGVARVVASAWWGPHGPMIGNDAVAAIVRAHPDKVTGIASVDLHRPMDGVRELRRCVKELGLRGLRLLPWLWAAAR